MSLSALAPDAATSARLKRWLMLLRVIRRNAASVSLRLRGGRIMLDDRMATLARVRALALGAMIDAGGKPCWVAASPLPPLPPAPTARPRPAKREAALLASLPDKLRERLESTLARLDAGPTPQARAAAIAPAARCCRFTSGGAHP